MYAARVSLRTVGRTRVVTRVVVVVATHPPTNREGRRRSQPTARDDGGRNQPRGTTVATNREGRRRSRRARAAGEADAAVVRRTDREEVCVSHPPGERSARNTHPPQRTKREVTVVGRARWTRSTSTSAVRRRRYMPLHAITCRYMSLHTSTSAVHSRRRVCARWVGRLARLRSRSPRSPERASRLAATWSRHVSDRSDGAHTPPHAVPPPRCLRARGRGGGRTPRAVVLVARVADRGATPL